MHIKGHQLIRAKFSKLAQFIANPIEEAAFRAFRGVRLENGGEEACDHSFDNGDGRVTVSDQDSTPRQRGAFQMVKGGRIVLQLKLK